MSGGTACTDKTHRNRQAVIQRHGNASAFNGYRWQHSDYSSVICLAPGCGEVWRTKAAYVEELPDVVKLDQFGRESPGGNYHLPRCEFIGEIETLHGLPGYADARCGQEINHQGLHTRHGPYNPKRDTP